MPAESVCNLQVFRSWSLSGVKVLVDLMGCWEKFKVLSSLSLIFYLLTCKYILVSKFVERSITSSYIGFPVSTVPQTGVNNLTNSEDEETYVTGANTSFYALPGYLYRSKALRDGTQCIMMWIHNSLYDESLGVMVLLFF